jgi:pullulanase/glycogen debranching enzyme
VLPDGVNFNIFSRDAAAMELLLFDREDSSSATRIVAFDATVNRTYHYWHVFVPGVQPGQLYAYRAYGSNEPVNGLRFDPTKLLLDPSLDPTADPLRCALWTRYRGAEAVKRVVGARLALFSADPP